MKNIGFGKDGEDTAIELLKNKGYAIIGRNWRRRYGELDVIARSPEGIIVFVEVKAIDFFPGGISPEDHMSPEKIRKFKRVSEAWANEHSKSIRGELGWRCDVIGLTRIGKDFVIKHYENI